MIKVDHEDGKRRLTTLAGAPAFHRLLRPYWRFAPLVVILGLVTTMIESLGIGALIPLIGLLVSKGVPAGLPAPLGEISRLAGEISDSWRAHVLIAIVLAMLAAKGAVHALNNTLIARVHASINRTIMDAIARHTLALDYPALAGGAGTSAFNLFSRSSWLVFEAVRSVLQILQAGASALVFGLILIWLDWRLTAIAAAGAIMVAAMLARVESVQRKTSQRAAERDTELLLKARELTEGARVIRVFGREAAEERAFAKISRDTFREYRAMNVASGLVTPLFDLMIACVFAGLLLTAYRLAIPVEQVTTFLLLLIRAQPQAGIISTARASLAAYAGPLAEFEALMRLPVPVRQQSREGTVAIEAIDQPVVFEQVDFTYPDGTRAISGVSFTIEPGTVTALLGRSGAGKSTLINLLLGLYRPTAGCIRHGLHPLDAFEPAAWLRHIALAGQDIGLFNGTVAENIAYGAPGASDHDIWEAARAAGAEGFIRAMPNGLTSPVGEWGCNLSGGQQQRIALARALLKRPDLLILDEATSAVDAMTESEITALLKERRWFRTAIVISHRPSTVAACGSAIVIENGSVIEAGPLERLAYHAEMGGYAA